jgi:hypothetical protein
MSGMMAMVTSNVQKISTGDGGVVGFDFVNPPQSGANVASTWTDSVNGIVATVANSPTYTSNFGGGVIFTEGRQNYIDVPTSRGAGAFTISIAAQIPGSPQSHYNAIICGNTVARSGNYIMSRYWQGDGLEFGHTSSWATGGFLTMNQLAWYDYVWNGVNVSLYKNGTLVTSGTTSGAHTGWLNPLRFGGDEAVVSSNNTMAPGVLYRMRYYTAAMDAAAITAQFAAVRGTYSL